MGSNRRPTGYEPAALTAELQVHIYPFIYMAASEGFEPSRQLSPPYRISNPAPSATWVTRHVHGLYENFSLEQIFILTQFFGQKKYPSHEGHFKKIYYFVKTVKWVHTAILFGSVISGFILAIVGQPPGVWNIWAISLRVWPGKTVYGTVWGGLFKVIIGRCWEWLSGGMPISPFASLYASSGDIGRVHGIFCNWGSGKKLPPAP